MPTDYLALMRAAVRQDLHDEDASNYRWTNDVINRHITRALAEMSKEIPVEKKTTLTTTAGSRAVTATSLTNVLDILKVEYPVDSYPPTYVQFTWWASTLTLILDSAPSSVANVYVYWTQMHELDTDSTSLAAWMEPILATGAAAYAALDWASYATNRVNLGGKEAQQFYQKWGEQRLADFHKLLRKYGTRGSLRTSGLYTPYDPNESKLTDPGPV